MPISLITTVLNEGETIGSFLESIASQTRKPDEIIIVDGGSNDYTAQKIKDIENLPIRLIENNCNISRGRNIAIANASHEIIAVTDGGCFLDKNWLERISQFDENTDVIVGNYRPKIRSLFDACQYSFTGLFGATSNPKKFPISSRSLAFRKSVWRELGGYPEWLNYSEDTYFHNLISLRGYRIKYEKNAIVEWSLRKTLKSIFKQYFLYMEGQGMAGLYTKRHLLRFIVYIGSCFCILLGIRNSYFILPLLLGIGLYLLVPLSNFRKLGAYRLLSGALIIIPLMLVLVDAAKMSGYLSGLYKRITGKVKPTPMAPI